MINGEALQYIPYAIIPVLAVLVPYLASCRFKKRARYLLENLIVENLQFNKIDQEVFNGSRVGFWLSISFGVILFIFFGYLAWPVIFQRSRPDYGAAAFFIFIGFIFLAIGILSSIQIEKTTVTVQRNSVSVKFWRSS